MLLVFKIYHFFALQNYFFLKTILYTILGGFYSSCYIFLSGLIVCFLRYIFLPNLLCTGIYFYLMYVNIKWLQLARSFYFDYHFCTYRFPCMESYCRSCCQFVISVLIFHCLLRYPKSVDLIAELP